MVLYIKFVSENQLGVTMKKFYEDIPIFRAVAALLVVAVHVTASTAYSYSNKVFTHELLGYINQIGRLGTPVFAVISAFLLMSSVINRGFSIKYFFKSRFTKIFIPYVIWTFVYLIFRYYYLDNFNSDTPFINYFVFGNASTHLYFIVVVLQFYLVFPLLQYLRKGPLLLMVYVISCIVNYFWVITGNVELSSAFITKFLNSRLFILNWISYFMLGIVYVNYYKEIQAIIYKYKSIFVIAITVLFLDLILSIDLKNFYNSTENIKNIIYIPFFLVFLSYFYNFIKSDRLLFNTLTFIGNYSMGIYLVHYMIIRIVRDFSVFDGVTAGSKFMSIYLLTVVFSVTISYIISLLPYGNYL